MTCPSLYISWFDDDRGRTSYYLDRIRSINVPKPTEVLIPLENDADFTEEATAIQNVMRDQSWQRAFVKTECKAAVNSLKRGSFILEDSLDSIKSTVESLITQNNAQSWPHGEYLVVREWIDLNFCLELSHSCHPEVRYFIDDGDVIGRTPLEYNPDTFVCGKQYEYLTETLQDSSPPDELAQRVASEFDEATWGIDFALDTNGNWWFIEMNFNCVYWNDEYDKWWNMCGQGDNEPFSPLWMHGAALPNTQ